MPNTPVKLVVSDMDGTLLNDEKVLSKETLRVARLLKERGVKLCLVSSRFPPGIERFCQELELDTPYGALNGGEILAADGEILSSLVLDPGTVKEACEALRQGGADAWIYRKRDWFVTDLAGPHVAHESEVVGSQPQRVDDLNAYFEGVGKLQGVSDNEQELAKLEREIGDRLGQRASVHRSSGYYLDITPSQANKGFAAQFMARRFGCDMSEVACIGDMSNDVPMLKLAGVSIAMGNAHDEVKAHAKHVTSSNKQEGWARAMEEFVLSGVS